MSDSTAATKRLYEIMFIIGGDQTDDTINTISDEIRKEITSRDGAVKQEDVWGRREMAYPIKRQATGHYTVWHFEMTTDQMSSLNKHLRLNTNIMRYLITSVPENYALLTFVEMKTRGQKPEKKGRQAADDISAEQKTLRRPKAAPVAGPKSPAKVSTPAPVAEAKPEPDAAPAPVVKSEPKVKPEKIAATPEKTEEERLKELDKKLDELISEDTI